VNDCYATRVGRLLSAQGTNRDSACPSPRSAALLCGAQAQVQEAIDRKKRQIGYNDRPSQLFNPRRLKAPELTISDALFGTERALRSGVQQERGAERSRAAASWPEWVTDSGETGVFVPILGMVVKAVGSASPSPISSPARSSPQKPELHPRFKLPQGADSSPQASITKRGDTVQHEQPMELPDRLVYVNKQLQEQFSPIGFVRQGRQGSTYVEAPTLADVQASKLVHQGARCAWLPEDIGLEVPTTDNLDWESENTTSEESEAGDTAEEDEEGKESVDRPQLQVKPPVYPRPKTREPKRCPSEHKSIA